MNKKALFMCLAVALILCAGTMVMVACGNRVDERDLAYVTMSINPSIELVVNGKNEVLAINGTNDDGKILLQDEDLVGKDLDLVTVRIADLLIELKYVTEENGEDKTLQLNVSTGNAQFEANIEKSFDKAMKKLKDTYNVTVEKVQKLAHDQLVKLALKAHPEKTQEELEAMTDKELVTLLQVDVLERAHFALVSIEEEYYKFKDMEFKFRYYEEIKTAISAIDDIALQAKKLAFNVAMGTLEASVNTLRAFEEQFLDKVCDSVVIIVGGVNWSEEVVSAIKEKIDEIIVEINKIYAKLDEYQKELCKNIDVDALLRQVEQDITDAKNGILARYEERFLAALQKADQKVSDAKRALLEGQKAA